MLRKIISGCQTGADIAGVDAAIDNNFPYGGWVPKGRKTEDGPLPDRYIVDEMTKGGYPKRTLQNVLDSDGTVIFTHGKLSGGSALTKKYAIQNDKPWIHVDLAAHDTTKSAALLSVFIEENSIKTLNVAGRSASKDGKIYAAVYAVIDTFLKRVGGRNKHHSQNGHTKRI